jgi:Mg2+/Co2+ transporter CorB
LDAISLGSLFGALAALLLASGFSSMAETAMMAVNRYRLRHRARQGSRGAKLALSLLAETDKLLGVILLVNTLVNAAAATLTAVITKRLFGEGEWALALGTAAISFALLVFCEITPKVIGASRANQIAPLASFVLAPILKIVTPIVWFVNLFVQGLLKLLAIRSEGEGGHSPLTQEELRSLVLEGQSLRGKHRAMLANLFDLDSVHVDDVMTPRSQIEAIDLGAKSASLLEQLATSYHTRLPAYEDELDNIAGIVHLKQVLRLQQAGEIDAEQLRTILRPAYYIPAGTPLLAQLQHFQAAGQRLGLVVDEYGELLGLVTLEDILEEIVGEFTTQSPGLEAMHRENDGSIVVDGMTPLRVLNRKLGTAFPLDGPKTLNGLIVGELGEIPDAGARLRFAGQSVEVMQVQDRAVKIVKLLPPVGRSASPALQTSGEQASSIR